MAQGVNSIYKNLRAPFVHATATRLPDAPHLHRVMVLSEHNGRYITTTSTRRGRFNAPLRLIQTYLLNSGDGVMTLTGHKSGWKMVASLESCGCHIRKFWLHKIILFVRNPSVARQYGLQVWSFMPDPIRIATAGIMGGKNFLLSHSLTLELDTPFVCAHPFKITPQQLHHHRTQAGCAFPRDDSFFGGTLQFEYIKAAIYDFV